MAISFTTGTINVGGAAALGQAMAEKIRDDVIAHAGWTLVEEYTAPAGLVTWYVLKCSAAVSGLASDFYVIYHRTLASGEIRMFICEGYTQATHTAAFYCTLQGNTNIAFDASGRAPGTFVLGTAVLSNAVATNPYYITWTPSGTSTKWWLTVDNDGLTVAFNGASNGFIHVGAFVPLASQPDPMPLHLFGYTGGSYMAFITRNPALANVNFRSDSLALPQQVPPALGFQGRLDVNDKLQADQRPVAELGVVLNPANADRPVVGWALGKMKRVRVGENGTQPAGVAFGDAYALQGRLWVPYLPTDNRMWDTGVAA